MRFVVRMPKSSSSGKPKSGVKPNVRLAGAAAVALAALACEPGAARGQQALRPGPHRVESLGVMVRAATPEHRFLVRLPGGGARLVMYYTPQSYARTPFQIVDVDLATGAVRVTDGVEGRPGPQATALHSGGRLYVATSQPAWWMAYDFATGRAERLGRLSGTGAQQVSEGDDGALYVGQLPRAQVERYDPRGRRLEALGSAGLAQGGDLRYAYTVGADDRFVYVATGQLPWGLVVLDRSRGTRATFLEGERLRWLTVSRFADGWYARGLPQAGGERWWALRGGRPVPVASAPRAAAASALCEVASEGSARQCAAKLGWEVDAEAPAAGEDGRVVVRWRRNGDARWREATARVRTEAFPIHRLVAADGGRLLGFGAFYGPAFTFDPAAGRRQLLGRPFVSVYDALAVGGQWYVAGYPTALLRYDPGQPWTLAASPLGTAGGAGRNPRRVPLDTAAYGKHYRYLARDRAGTVYLGAHHERGSVGGAIAWHDPASGRGGGLREPFARHDVSGLAALPGDTLLVYSGAAVGGGGEGRLFVFDTRRKRVVHAFAPLPGEADPGRIVAVGPGLVVGVTGGARPKVYAADVLARRVRYARPLAAPARWTPPSRLALGPDGHVWLTLGGAVARIDPADGSVERVADAGAPGNVVFSGRDLYLDGDTVLRRVRGLFR